MKHDPPFSPTTAPDAAPGAPDDADHADALAALAAAAGGDEVKPAAEPVSIPEPVEPAPLISVTVAPMAEPVSTPAPPPSAAEPSMVIAPPAEPEPAPASATAPPGATLADDVAVSVPGPTSVGAAPAEGIVPLERPETPEPPLAALSASAAPPASAETPDDLFSATVASTAHDDAENPPSPEVRPLRRRTPEPISASPAGDALNSDSTDDTAGALMGASGTTREEPSDTEQQPAAEPAPHHQQPATAPPRVAAPSGSAPAAPAAPSRPPPAYTALWLAAIVLRVAALAVLIVAVGGLVVDLNASIAPINAMRGLVPNLLNAAIAWAAGEAASALRNLVRNSHR